MEHKGAALVIGGWGAWAYSFIVSVTPIIQFIGAVLGVIATGFAIYFYVRKLLDKDSDKEN
jgi:hypothetical protein